MIAYDGGIMKAVVLCSENALHKYQSTTKFVECSVMIITVWQGGTSKYLTVNSQAKGGDFPFVPTTTYYTHTHTNRKKGKKLKCGRVLHSVEDFSMIFFVKKYLVCDSTFKLLTVGSIKQIDSCILRIFVRIMSFNNGC